jgi:uncharacterized protein
MELTLHQAAERGDIETLTRLLDSGMDVDLKDEVGDTSLLRAASRGKEAALRLLVARGADVNAADGWSSGNTALMEIVWYGMKESVLLLLARGADVKAQNLDGETALSFAARKLEPDPEMVKILMDAGAKVRLYEAAWMGEQDTIRDLVAQGADINERIFHTTPLMAAVYAKRPETVALLRELGAEIFDLHKAAWLGDCDVIREMVRQGHDLNATLESDFTPLMLAIKAGQVEAAHTLLELGADPILDVPTGTTALDMAQRNGLDSLIEKMEASVRHAKNARPERNEQNLAGS